VYHQTGLPRPYTICTRNIQKTSHHAKADPTTTAVGAINAIRLILNTPRKAAHTTPIKTTWILTTTRQLLYTHKPKFQKYWKTNAAN
jgi:hypothetical protein